MHPLESQLSDRLSQAVRAAYPNQDAQVDGALRAATRPEFGHFQTSLPMQLASVVGERPRDVAQAILEQLDVDDLCEPPTIAGAGFINFTLRPRTLADAVNVMLSDDRLGVDRPDRPSRIVVDYSSPNVAKQMHVGHLRSTVIGDALAATLEFAGHEVIRQNHIGDWGTQFGMLIEQLADEGLDPSGLNELDLDGLDGLYKRARAHFDSDEVFAGRSRSRVVALQSGDPDTLEMWRSLVAVSVEAFSKVYARLGSRLNPADIAGESSYNELLPGLVEDLRAAGLLVESDGALCAFLPGFIGRDGSPLPIIVRKADGGFGYDATDLAALRSRFENLGADRIVYVVDARQSLHFDQVFALARAAGWVPDGASLEHVAFGTVLGEDGRPFKTRAGQAVSLASLLDEATERAAQVTGADADAPEVPGQAGPAQVGIGAVKYADLSSDLGRDYTFSFDRMVALDGNTGPYLQYAHARVCSLLDRAGGAPTSVSALEDPAEVRLALLLTQFPGVVAEVASTLAPHRMCTYLYQVAAAFSFFYETCPVLSSSGQVREDRLAMCVATREVLARGLDLLCIAPPSRMPSRALEQDRAQGKEQGRTRTQAMSTRELSRGSSANRSSW